MLCGSLTTCGPTGIQLLKTPPSARVGRWGKRIWQRRCPLGVTAMSSTGKHLFLETSRRSTLHPELDIKQGLRRFRSQTVLTRVVLRRHHTQSSAMKLASSFVAVVFFAAASLVGAAPISSQEIKNKSAEGLSLLRLGPDVDPVWKTEDEKWELKKAGVNFMDVTRTWTGMQSDPALQKPSEKVYTTATCAFFHIRREIDNGSHVS